MHYLYIIYSETIDRFYVGESPNPDVRLTQHNQHYFKKGYTKAANDWVVVLSRNYSSREDVIYLERFIKRMKSKKFIKKVIDRPQILDDILAKNDR